MTTTETGPSSDPKEVRLQRHRIRTSSVAVVNSLVESGVLALFAQAGTISWGIVAAFFALSMGLALPLHLFIKFGYNLRFQDKSLVIPQLLSNGVVQLAFIVIAPRLAVLFLLALLVLFSYGIIQLTARQFLAGWLLYGVSTALALYWVRDEFGYPGVSAMEIALVWLFFFLALRRLTLASAEFSLLRSQLSDKNRQLHASLKRIEELASHDPLTGVLNRRVLIEHLETELQRAGRTGHSFCFAMIDLDHFKQVNDRFGHPAGDAVLKTFAACAKRSLRTVDRLGRLGGEEFGIVLPATNMEQAMQALQRLAQEAAGCDWESIGSGLSITFSAGLASVIPDDCVESLVKRADEALYRAKREGRNRIVPA
jgi:diguanylate cyclase (GGDEF)-like protein